MCNDLNKELLKILHFYNTYIAAPEIKKFSKVQLLKELPFYDELKIVKINNAFSGCTRTYKIEVIAKRDVAIQLKAGENSIKDLFKDYLLIELKGFKYQVALKIYLSKVKSNGEIEYSPVYFNSLTKTVINDDYKLDQAFSEIIYRVDNWISYGSGWVFEEIIN